MRLPLITLDWTGVGKEWQMTSDITTWHLRKRFRGLEVFPAIFTLILRSSPLRNIVFILLDLREVYLTAMAT